ncbi:MAG: type IV pilus assembly protein PilM [Patescibacteria group bacterium]
MSSLGNMFGSLSSMLSGNGGTNSVLGIDIGSSSIKIVQLRTNKESAILETYGEIALGPYAGVAVGKATKLPVDKTAEALRDLMKEANVTAVHAGVSIPFASSLISMLDLPNVDDVQLKRMIPIEARKYIPIPISEVLLDWFVIPESEKEDDAFDRVVKEGVMQKKGREVLLVAIHNEALRAYQTIMETAGVSVSFFEIEIFSTIRSALDRSPVPIAVVDMGASTTKIYIVERGVVHMTHLLNIGAQHITESLARAMGWTFEKAERMKREIGLTDSPTYTREENDRIHQTIESTFNRMFTEVNRVLLSFGKRYNKNVSHVVLSGGGSSMPNLSRTAQDGLHAELQIAHPFGKVESPAFLEEVLRTIGPGFSVAVGVALRKLSEK